MAHIAINTSQNVNINFNIASVGERIVAYFIDTAIRIGIFFLTYYFFMSVLNFDQKFESMDQFSIMAIWVVISLPVMLYYLILESTMQGQTIGKKIMKVRVIKIDGYQASFTDYFVRWLLRIVDFFGNVGIVALISAIVTKDTQRLGDLAAGTTVISLKNDVNISHTILENLHHDYAPTFPQVIALSDNDIRIIKENYQRSAKSGDSAIIRKLSNKIKETLKIEEIPKELTEKKFIDTIIKDYNFYTGKDS